MDRYKQIVKKKFFPLLSIPNNNMKVLPHLIKNRSIIFEQIVMEDINYKVF
jgi:hypothetical protein